MSQPHELHAGTRLGRYVVVRKIGSGGMGAVYLAQDDRLGRPVALKVPHFDKADDETRQRFLREANLAIGLPHHPHLCPVHDAGQINGTPFFVMPFVEGRSLQEVLVPGQPWPVEQALAVVGKIALALGQLHAHGIVHRDLKPGNVMMQPSGEPLLMDLGLARSFRAEGWALTQTGKSMGTPAYMSPEQFNDARRVKEPADIYSLGVLLYELLTTKRPFHAPLEILYYQILNVPAAPPSQLRPGLDPRLDAVCLKALSKTPEQRQQNVAEFLHELGANAPSGPVNNGPTAQYAPFQPVEERSLTAVTAADEPRVGRSPRRGPGKWIVGVLCLLVLAIPAGWVWWGESDGNPSQPAAPPVEEPEEVRTARALQQSWAARLGRQVDEEYDLGDGLALTAVLIPPGTFTMGSPLGELERASDEEPHQVEITTAFYLGKYEVTQEQYTRVTGAKNRSNFQEGDTRRCPVDSVTWPLAEAFCQKLSSLLGRRVELPSEAQWEYACRAGTRTPYHFGAALNGTEANCDGNHPYGTPAKGAYLEKTRPVGCYQANAFGLFDMHGNVYEWCADYYGPYAGLAARDPLRTETVDNGARVLRGGAWNVQAKNCRAAFRNRDNPELRHSSNGFRVAIRLD